MLASTARKIRGGIKVQRTVDPSCRVGTQSRPSPLAKRDVVEPKIAEERCVGPISSKDGNQFQGGIVDSCAELPIV